MKLLKPIALALFPLLLSGTMTGQDETQPLPPTLDMVTVDPYTGSCTIRWLPSESPDVEKYIIYATDDLYGLTAIDSTSSPYVTEYIHINSFARYKSVGYSIAARDSSGKNSPISDLLWTVYLATENDSCNSSIVLSWTPHTNSIHPSTRYELWLSEADQTASLHLSLPKTDTLFRFQTYLPGTKYCFFIRATDEESAYVSSSNMACVTTGSEVAPSWVRIEAIAVEAGGITVSAAYDQVTDMEIYRLLRYNPSGFAWEQAASAEGSSGKVMFTLPAEDTTMIRLYRVAAVNRCGLNATLSEPARNMVLKAEFTGIRIDLRWNRPVSGGAELYSVWRDTGEGLREVAMALNDTVWSEEYAPFAMEMSGTAVVYLITASDPSMPPGTPGHRSSAASIEGTDNLYMPNAFTPGRGGENALFRPEFAFVPGGYDFRIYSRNGLLLFRTTDHGEGWDGRYNDAPMPSGVYLWSLRIITPSGRNVVRNGTVTILP